MRPSINPILDRESLCDNDFGVLYFKRAMRPHFVKGNQRVFLLIFYQSLRCYRGQMDILRWIGRLCVVKKRLTDSWMDLMGEFDDTSREFLMDYTEALQRYPGTDKHEAFEEWSVRQRERHKAAFPIQDNLFALMVTVQADLSEQQREKLSAHMTNKGIGLQQYTFEHIRECMIELLCVPRSSLENPSYRVSGQGRTFAVMDYGEIDGENGYWAECEETGDEGFYRNLKIVSGLMMKTVVFGQTNLHHSENLPNEVQKVKARESEQAKEKEQEHQAEHL